MPSRNGKAQKGLLLVGYGGHARSVADVALAAGYGALEFIDDNAQPGETFAGFPVKRGRAGPLPEGWSAFPASGDNAARREQVAFIKERGWALGTVVSPTATLGAGAKVGPGCFIAHHAHLGPLSTLGTGVILNTSAVVDHDCVVEDYVHVSVHAGVSGRCRLGEGVLIGAGACLIDRITVPAGTVVGAGSVVVRSIERPGTYIGMAVRSIRKPEA